MAQNWTPDSDIVSRSNIMKSMKELGFTEFTDFFKWAADNRAKFWEHTTRKLGIRFKSPYSDILDLSAGLEKPYWFKGSSMNIAESCFKSNPDSTAVKYSNEDDTITKISYKQLEEESRRVGSSLQNLGLTAGDAIAIDMPMTYEAVCIYLGAILAGLQVVTVADSFASEEIKVRLDIAGAKTVFTQDVILRAGKALALYDKVKKAGDYQCVVIQLTDSDILETDISWKDFLSSSSKLETIYCDPEDTMTILFSSGTTGNPKAIPWNHTTPVKSASDGYYHHNIQEGDTVCWPTNLGWMMGPWLVFASLINNASIALFNGAPVGEGFGKFVEEAEVTMLGVVPSLVRIWKSNSTMERFNWNAIKCFSSTGECSNPEDMSWLMDLAGNKPVIEYCGGTETGGGYITGTVVQESRAATFSTPALGGDFIILDENGNENDSGEVFILPPIMGLSTKLINRDHHEVYYSGTPSPGGKLCRRHGDHMQKTEDGYYKAQGRVDDSMNLGGIKVSSTQIEELINKLDFVKESAAIGIPPANGGPDQLVICYVKSSCCNKERALVEMKNLVRKELNPLFKVADCIAIESLPRTASNKVMRRKLRDLCSQ